MSANKKVLDASIEKKSEGFYKIRSPILGSIKFLVRANQYVNQNQCIALVVQLDKSYQIILPNNLAGSVENFSKKSLGLTQYGEHLFDISNKSLAPSNEQSQEQDLSKSSNLQKVRSPMDGMIYLRPSPTENDFVSLGEEIEPGSTLALIEVMKCYYPLIYEGNVSARLERIACANQSAVSSNDVYLNCSSYSRS